MSYEITCSAVDTYNSPAIATTTTPPTKKVNFTDIGLHRAIAETLAKYDNAPINAPVNAPEASAGYWLRRAREIIAVDAARRAKVNAPINAPDTFRAAPDTFHAPNATVPVPNATVPLPTATVLHRQGHELEAALSVPGPHETDFTTRIRMGAR